MSAVAEIRHGSAVAEDFRANRAEMIRVLKNSLYSGAKDESVGLVLAYCEAARLDVMQKPVHIVPMSVKTGRKNQYGDDEYETIDTVMPGIGLYRTQAARTGVYAGKEEPEYGPTQKLAYRKKITEWCDGPNGKRQKKDKWVDATLEYPEWCKVTVYKLVQGTKCAYPAKEFFLENYATASRSTDAPNAMWERRPRGQLAKCAEAQALRMAFPDAVGAAPTAEEMEGRAIEADELPPTSQPKRDDLMPRSTTEPPDADVADAEFSEPHPPQAQQSRAQQTDIGEKAKPGMLKVLRARMVAAGLDDAAVCTHFALASLEDLPAAKINDAMKFVAGGAA